MSTDVAAPTDGQDASQEFLDANQYSMHGILRYERIFGDAFVSTGGLTLTKAFCELLPLQYGSRVLDIGVGTGGSAFYMAREYGCHVTGVDLSCNMTQLAEKRRSQLPTELQQRLEFQTADCTTVDYPTSSYDIVYSRDTILHISNKQVLFERCLRWLKPGGVLFITDYCQADSKLSEEFVNYRAQRGYQLLTVNEYGQQLRDAGFVDVEATDNSKSYLRIIAEEVARFQQQREEFLQAFGQKDYTDIVSGWEAKIRRGTEGSQVWGLFQARKPAA